MTTAELVSALRERDVEIKVLPVEDELHLAAYVDGQRVSGWYCVEVVKQS